MKLSPFLLVAFILTGCATVSEVTPYGNGTYIVVASDMSAATSPPKLQANAAQKANEFCATTGTTMQPTTGGMVGSGPEGTSASVVFYCNLR